MAFAFKNWGGNQACNPLALHQPATEQALIALVCTAAEAGEHVKVVGAGHSFTDIACTDGHMVSLDNYRQVIDVDTRAATPIGCRRV